MQNAVYDKFYQISHINAFFFYFFVLFAQYMSIIKNRKKIQNRTAFATENSEKLETKHIPMNLMERS